MSTPCNTWVTGAGGFMGGHLVERLVSKGDTVLATSYRPTTKIDEMHRGATTEICDLRDRDRVRGIIADFQPDKIFHLAAQSYPTTSWTDPWYTIESNVIGTVNIFEALKDLDAGCKVLNACSSAEYGMVRQEETPVTEDHPLKPLHPYGVSKAAQEMLAYQYHVNFGLKPVSVRIFNTTGPRKVNDVCSDLTRRLVQMEKDAGSNRRLRVGSLTTRRAIMDVRDCIRGFDVALEKATVGETYNIGGESVYEIQEIVDVLRTLVDGDFDLWQDPELLRPTDEPIIWGSTEKFREATGWLPTISLEQTLADMLTHWRQVL